MAWIRESIDTMSIRISGRKSGSGGREGANAGCISDNVDTTAQTVNLLVVFLRVRLYKLVCGRRTQILQVARCQD
jgi:hypothetical protein